MELKKGIKGCCAELYAGGWIPMLLGDSFHPGGLALTEKLGRLLGLSPSAKILDVASGRGATAIFLAKTFGCFVMGIDMVEKNLNIARHATEKEGLENLIKFVSADGERLPFRDGIFEAVISECSFSIFPDKEASAREMFRVLRPGGRLGITDITVKDGDLPQEMRDILSLACCTGDARPAEGYEKIFQGAGFEGFYWEDESTVLVDLLDKIKKGIFWAELGKGLGVLDFGNLDIKAAKRLLNWAAEAIKKGSLGYTLLTARRPW